MDKRDVITEDEIITLAGDKVATAYEAYVEELTLTPATQKKLAQQLAILFAKLSQF